MIFSRSKKNKKEKTERLFKKEAYIPKKKLEKKDRSLQAAPSQKGGEKKREERSGAGRRILVFFLWICFIGEIMYVLLFAQFFVITQVGVNTEGGAEQIKKEQIKSFVSEAWQGKWLNLIPKNNLLLVSTHHQERRLSARYPKLSSVDITKHFPQLIEVTTTEKPYQLLWCSREDCYLVNKEGITESADVFFQYQEEQGKSFRIVDMAEQPVGLGSPVLALEDRQFVHDLVTDFETRTGLRIEGNLERPSIYAREMRLRTEKGFTLFLNTRLPVADTLNNVMLLLKKEVPESEWGQIDYIDVRTENRIYYTRKDRTPEKTEVQKLREEEEEKKREEENKKQESQ